MPRYALGIEYDGTDFLGWQTQHQEPTVQQTVERAVSRVADMPVEVVCAGRTDTGVHARAQVVHFDCPNERSDRAWVLGSNANLPSSVAVVWARPVADAFHARYAARRRRYRYTIQNRLMRPALHARFAAWERVPLEADLMHLAAQQLVGEHDFTSFRTLACQAKTPVRTMFQIGVRRIDDRVEVELCANAFLHHMVRNIVGSLLLVGRGEQPGEWIGDVLRGKDRSKAGPTAPAAGLCFESVLYPPEHGLPPEHCL